MSEALEGKGNFASYILSHAKAKPNHKAIIIPKKWDDQRVLEQEEMTYGELASRVQSLRDGFANEGIQAGDRVVVLFPVCIDLYAVIIALWASGITAVLIDTGMGAKRIKLSLETANAKAVISIHSFLKYRFFLRPLWKIPKKYTRDKGWFLVKPFHRLVGTPKELPAVDRKELDEALITFTSGSTGRPKGADRNHGHLTSQHLSLAEEYPPQPDQVDMPCFPVVALHDLCCGITVAMPPLDFSNPGGANPVPITQFARDHGVTSLTGAPAYMSILANHLLKTNCPNLKIRQLGVGGAPVPKELCQRLQEAFPKAEGFVVYGSTEAEPIAHAHLEEAMAHTGEGYLVGTVAKAATVALLNLPTPVPQLDEREVAPYEVPRGEIGEVVVSGKHVNRGYIENPEANRENKLYSPSGLVWHRTGDLAYWTESGFLSLVGRLKDVVAHPTGIIQPYPLEATLEEVECVTHAAVISTPRYATGIIVLVAATNEQNNQQAVISAIRSLPVMQPLGDLPICFVEQIPVDGRHNSKIDRPSLRAFVDTKASVISAPSAV